MTKHLDFTQSRVPNIYTIAIAFMIFTPCYSNMGSTLKLCSSGFSDEADQNLNKLHLTGKKWKGFAYFCFTLYLSELGLDFTKLGIVSQKIPAGWDCGLFDQWKKKNGGVGYFLLLRTTHLEKKKKSSCSPTYARIFVVKCIYFSCC